MRGDMLPALPPRGRARIACWPLAIERRLHMTAAIGGVPSSFPPFATMRDASFGSRGCRAIAPAVSASSQWSASIGDVRMAGKALRRVSARALDRTPAAGSGRQRQGLELLAGGAKSAELVDSRAHR
jgi:hypothetical protein